MILISFFFFTIRSEFSYLYQDMFNKTVSCIDKIVLSNSVFFDMSVPVIDNCYKNSISINDCFFSQVTCIINSNEHNWEQFTFIQNCCRNDEIESNQSYIGISSKSCLFKMNTFSGFSSCINSEFIFFNSPEIRITNINLTNNERFNSAIFIENPSTVLQFNDITFDKVNFGKHIYISNGELKQHYFDRISDNGGKDIYFMKAETNATFIITRVFMPNDMLVDIDNGFIWFVDSYMSERFPHIDRTAPLPGAIVIDSIHPPFTNPFFIDHLSVPECPTNNVQLAPPPHHTVGKSMKIKIAFSFIGGALFGVVVFLIIYFTVKYSIKCYQKKQDQKRPVFDI